VDAGVWNSHCRYHNYEGAGWLCRTFETGACSAAVLNFGAVTQQANVWLDGEPLGEHYGGFLPFSFLLPSLEPGQHQLVVRVDNTHDMASTIPSANLDWCRYGGIPRPVWVEELAAPAYIVSLRLTPALERGQGRLRVRAELFNLTDTPLDGICQLRVDGQEMRAEPVHLEAGGSQVLLFGLTLPKVTPWSPGDPRLYTVQMSFGGDDLIERTGFGNQCAGNEILLNGAPVRSLESIDTKTTRLGLCAA
jgi:beta-glucuronidase